MKRNCVSEPSTLGRVEDRVEAKEGKMVDIERKRG